MKKQQENIATDGLHEDSLPESVGAPKTGPVLVRREQKDTTSGVDFTKPLAKATHEAFAQGIAGGLNQVEAYIRATGWKPKQGKSKPHNQASVLAHRPDIISRIAAIQDETARRITEERVAAVVPASTSYSKAYIRDMVISELIDTVKKCKQRELAPDGKSYVFNARDSNTALQMLGKEIGMFVDRSEVRQGDIDAMSVEELEQRLAEEHAKLEREKAEAAAIFAETPTPAKTETAAESGQLQSMLESSDAEAEESTHITETVGEPAPVDSGSGRGEESGEQKAHLNPFLDC